LSRIKRKTKKSGITLVEVIVVASLISLIIGIGIKFYLNSSVKDKFLKQKFESSKKKNLLSTRKRNKQVISCYFNPTKKITSIV